MRSAACGHAAYREREGAGEPVGCRKWEVTRGYEVCRGVLPFPVGRVLSRGAWWPFARWLRKTSACPPGLSAAAGSFVIGADGSVDEGERVLLNPKPLFEFKGLG